MTEFNAENLKKQEAQEHKDLEKMYQDDKKAAATAEDSKTNSSEAIAFEPVTTDKGIEFKPVVPLAVKSKAKLKVELEPDERHNKLNQIKSILKGTSADSRQVEKAMAKIEEII